MQDNKVENWSRQEKSVLIIEPNGQVKFDRVLKDGETVKISNDNQLSSYCQKKKNIIEIQDHIQKNEGSFVHLIYKYGYPLMDKLQTKCEGNKANIHIIRFLQLATYVTFGGKLFDRKRNEIKKSSLSKIWDTSSRNSINETYNLLKECDYIYEDKEGNILISEDLIVKGEVKDFKKQHKKDINLTFTRLFTQNIQDMYNGTEAKARKQLANLFKILPFINFNHNIFCDNPTEKDKSKLKFLSWTDLALICGVDNKNVTRFKNELFKLKIYGFDTIGEFKSGSGYYICINPKIFYGGNNIEDVSFLYKSFEMLEN